MASPEFELHQIEFKMRCPEAIYYTETKRFTCLVCDHTESMTQEVYKEHASTAQHGANTKAMTSQIYKKLQRFKILLALCNPYGCFVSDIQQMRDVKEKIEIEAGLFRYLFVNDDVRDFHTELQKLIVYEYKEVLVIVALAVWKAMCIQDVSIPLALCTAGSFTAIQECLQQWSHSGWKANKSAHRNANAIGIVVKAVLPFLSFCEADVRKKFKLLT